MIASLSFVHGPTAHQVTDRLVSLGRIGARARPWDRFGNKVVCHHTREAAISMAFCGLAHLGKKPTDVVIQERLAGVEIAPEALRIDLPGRSHESLFHAIQAVRQRLEDEVNRDDPKGSTTLEVAAVGFQRASPVWRPILWSIRRHGHEMRLHNHLIRRRPSRTEWAVLPMAVATNPPNPGGTSRR